MSFDRASQQDPCKTAPYSLGMNWYTNTTYMYNVAFHPFPFDSHGFITFSSCPGSNLLHTVITDNYLL